MPTVTSTRLRRYIHFPILLAYLLADLLMLRIRPHQQRVFHIPFTSTGTGASSVMMPDQLHTISAKLTFQSPANEITSQFSVNAFSCLFMYTSLNDFLCRGLEQNPDALQPEWPIRRSCGVWRWPSPYVARQSLTVVILDVFIVTCAS